MGLRWEAGEGLRPLQAVHPEARPDRGLGRELIVEASERGWKGGMDRKERSCHEVLSRIYMAFQVAKW